MIGDPQLLLLLWQLVEIIFVCSALAVQTVSAFLNREYDLNFCQKKEKKILQPPVVTVSTIIPNWCCYLVYLCPVKNNPNIIRRLIRHTLLLLFTNL